MPPYTTVGRLCFWDSGSLSARSALLPSTAALVTAGLCSGAAARWLPVGMVKLGSRDCLTAAFAHHACSKGKVRPDPGEPDTILVFRTCSALGPSPHKV